MSSTVSRRSLKRPAALTSNSRQRVTAPLSEEELTIDGPYENVWDAIEDDPAEASRLTVLSDLMMTLEDHIKGQGWTQREAAKHLGVSQPRVSDLVRGKINLFSVDALIAMLAAAGLRIEVRVKKAARPPKARP